VSSKNHEASHYVVLFILLLLLPLSLCYPTQHHVLRHPQSMFFPPCDKPSFTPI